jgi:hypothetical protein
MVQKGAAEKPASCPARHRSDSVQFRTDSGPILDLFWTDAQKPDDLYPVADQGYASTVVCKSDRIEKRTDFGPVLDRFSSLGLAKNQKRISFVQFCSIPRTINYQLPFLNSQMSTINKNARAKTSGQIWPNPAKSGQKRPRRPLQLTTDH